jgi:DNA modification methylase
MIDIRHGDALELLKTLPDGCVDAVVTDPPAGIAFMGKEWDDFRRTRNPADVGRDDVFGRTSRTGPEFGRRSREAFVAFLSAVMAEALRVTKPGGYGLVWAIPRTSHWTATALEDAGWEVRDRIAHIFGTGFPKGKACLKPAVEDWWLVRKPAKRMTPLNVDACRVETDGRPQRDKVWSDCDTGVYGSGRNTTLASGSTSLGRWPANLVLDEAAGAMLDEQAGPQKSGGTPPRRFAAKSKNTYGNWSGEENPDGIGRSEGMVSRFYYCAKASKADRGPGNNHPTVKNTALMRWLVRLITQPGDVVLDPFLGSGSTAVACEAEGRSCIGFEQSAEYVEIAKRRVAEATAGLFDGTPLGVT